MGIARMGTAGAVGRREGKGTLECTVVMTSLTFPKLSYSLIPGAVTLSSHAVVRKDIRPKPDEFIPVVPMSAVTEFNRRTIRMGSAETNP